MTITIVRTGDDYEPQRITTWRLRELLAKEKAYDAIVKASRDSQEAVKQPPPVAAVREARE